jgi:hypothetical protein
MARAEAPSPPAAQAVAPAPTAPSAGNHLTGNWLYVPARQQTAGLYPPEFIELHVEEASGTVRGRYRARYQVGDQAISPSVAFQFEGRADGAEAALPWNGPGGAQGEITLRLLPAGALEVAWVADRLGDLGLISGKATLVRKAE